MCDLYVNRPALGHRPEQFTVLWKGSLAPELPWQHVPEEEREEYVCSGPASWPQSLSPPSEHGGKSMFKSVLTSPWADVPGAAVISSHCFSETNFLGLLLLFLMIKLETVPSFQLPTQKKTQNKQTKTPFLESHRKESPLAASLQPPDPGLAPPALSSLVIVLQELDSDPKAFFFFF